MKIQIYSKLQEGLTVFDDVITTIKGDTDELFITNENRRSFREFEKLKMEYKDTVYVIHSLNSLGLNDADIATQLSWFIDHEILLVVGEIASTYEYGVSQPMNKAVLSTILQAILSGNKNIITVSFKRSNSGRNRLPFPENWDELYEKWEKKEISSKEFIQDTGLKKATFYNLLTEYKEIQSANTDFMKKYRIG